MTPAAAFLTRVIEADRSAILEGRYHALVADEAARAQALAALATAGDRPALTRISAGFARNQRLLAAALGGLQEAKSRRQLASQARNSLSSYDAAGQPASIASSQPTVVRRA